MYMIECQLVLFSSILVTVRKNIITWPEIIKKLYEYKHIKQVFAKASSFI